jgi:Domain of unknown function DUF11
MSLFRLPRTLGASRSLLVVAMLAGAAFSAVPAQAAPVSSINVSNGLQVQLTMPAAATLGKPAAFELTVTNTTTSTLNNVIVGQKFGVGSRLAGNITGLPPNSCVRGNTAFACLVPTLDPGASATLTFNGTQSVGSVVDTAAAQAFVNGLFTTSAVTLVSDATGPAVPPAPAPAPGGGGAGGRGGRIIP